VVNVLCDSSLLAGFASGSKRITAAIVDETWADYVRSVRPPPPPTAPEPPPALTDAGTAAPPAARSAPPSAPPSPPVAQSAPASAPPSPLAFLSAPPSAPPSPPPPVDPVPVTKAEAPLAEVEPPPPVPAAEPVTAPPLEVTPVVEPEAPSPARLVESEAQPAAVAAELSVPPPAAPDPPVQAPPPPRAMPPSAPAVLAAAARTPVRPAPPAPPPAPKRVTPVPPVKPSRPAHTLHRGRAAAVSPAMSLGVAGALVVVLAAGLYALSRRDDGSMGSFSVASLPSPLATTPKPASDPSTSPVAALAHPAATAPEAPVRPPAADPKSTPPPTALEPTGPVSAAEAAFLIEEFRLAYEARDVERIQRLFSADAVENDRHGREAVASGYQRAFENRSDIEYRLPSLRFEQRGDRAIVRSPFVTRFRTADGGAAQLNGSGEWQIERREGHPRIVVFKYELATTPKQREPQDRGEAGLRRSSRASRTSDVAD
jgi:ketosteroid isomerase-like protein